jgi:hypothetical protein
MAGTRYRSPVSDSDRWDAVELRPGDIVVSTPPKCGTTWTQMILLLLLHQTPELPAPISELAPWVDHLIRSRAELVELLEAQTGRRVIKTHTPLDGLPRVAGVTYVCVGRDPRDVARSMDHHSGNMNFEASGADMTAAAERDGIELPARIAPLPRPDDARERFWIWAENDTPPTEIASTLARTIHHIESFWDVDEVDVVLLHYDDLQDDLEGEMRRLAAHLGLDVPDHRWPELVEAATFESMRGRTTVTTPNAGKGHWRDDQQFFHKGSSGQWHELLDDADLERYRQRVDSLTTPAVAAWLHRGWP